MTKFWKAIMNKSDLNTKSYDELINIYFQSGGVIYAQHTPTRDELIAALSLGKKMIGRIGVVDDDNIIY